MKVFFKYCKVLSLKTKKKRHKKGVSKLKIDSQKYRWKKNTEKREAKWKRRKIKQHFTLTFYMWKFITFLRKHTWESLVHAIAFILTSFYVESLQSASHWCKKITTKSSTKVYISYLIQMCIQSQCKKCIVNLIIDIIIILSLRY